MKITVMLPQVDLEWLYLVFLWYIYDLLVLSIIFVVRDNLAQLYLQFKAVVKHKNRLLHFVLVIIITWMCDNQYNATEQMQF